jgi:hypothetical protein
MGFVVFCSLPQDVNFLDVMMLLWVEANQCHLLEEIWKGVSLD